MTHFLKRIPLSPTKLFKKANLFVLLLWVLTLVGVPDSFVFAKGAKATLGLNHCSFAFIDQSTLLDPTQLKVLTRKIVKEQAQDYEAWSDRVIIQLTRGRIYNRVKDLCKVPALCEEAAVAQAVRNEIIRTFEGVQELKTQMYKVRGLAVLVGISVGVAMTSHYTKTHIPLDVRWISEFVTIVSSIALYKLGAPLWDYLGGVAYRGAFRLSEGKSFKRQNNEMAYLKGRFEILQEKMTTFQQQEATRVSALINALESVLPTALELIQYTSEPSKQGLDRGADRIAGLLIRIRRFFPEIPPDRDTDVLRTVNITFKKYLTLDTEARKNLAEDVMKKILDADPGSSNPQTYERYKKIIQIWLGLEEPAP
jgi:hypothetical protein